MLFFTAACSPEVTTPSEPAGNNGRLVVYSGRSEALLQPVLNAFSVQYPDIEVLLKAGSNSELANAILEEQANPQADVFITTEIFTAQALAEQGAFQPYAPEGVNSIPAGFRSPDDLWVSLTLRARVIMYNTDLLTPEEVPTSIFELTQEQWRGQVATTSSTNGSMQAQIALMRQLIGDDGTEAWLKGMLDNDTTFFGGHTDVRKAVGTGEFALGLVNHYYYYLQLAEGSPVGVVYPDQAEGQIGLMTNATSAAIINGANNPASAQALIDFLLSEQGQQLFANENFEYPIIPGIPVATDIQPLAVMTLSEIDIAKAAGEMDATFALMEKVQMP